MLEAREAGDGEDAEDAWGTARAFACVPRSSGGHMSVDRRLVQHSKYRTYFGFSGAISMNRVALS